MPLALSHGMAHSPLVFLHVGAGLLALLAGAAALPFRKGSSRHRLTGSAFALRKSGLLVVPVLTVIVVMLYWLWRVRFSSARRKSTPQVKWTTQDLSPMRS